MITDHRLLTTDHCHGSKALREVKVTTDEMLSKEDFRKCAEFHGHICPGLAIGYRAARAGLEWLNDHRAEDEEIVAIVETDSCSVDAIQSLMEKKQLTWNKVNARSLGYVLSASRNYQRLQWLLSGRMTVANAARGLHSKLGKKGNPGDQNSG